jgi:Ca2+-binding EF-hand superfamily protein
MCSKSDQLNEAKQRVREAFITFEHREGSKLIDAKDIPTVVRCLGVNPTSPQIQMLQERITASAADTTQASQFIALEQCETIIATWLLETKDILARDDYFTIMRAFKALDPDGKGYVDAEQLRTLLTSCDDGLTADEANSMLSVAADDQGQVMYQEYAMKLATDARPI